MHNDRQIQCSMMTLQPIRQKWIKLQKLFHLRRHPDHQQSWSCLCIMGIFLICVRNNLRNNATYQYWNNILILLWWHLLLRWSPGDVIISINTFVTHHGQPQKVCIFGFVIKKKCRMEQKRHTIVTLYTNLRIMSLTITTKSRVQIMAPAQYLLRIATEITQYLQILDMINGNNIQVQLCLVQNL